MVLYYWVLLLLSVVSCREVGLRVRRATAEDFCPHIVCPPGFSELADTLHKGQSCLFCEECYANGYRSCVNVTTDKDESNFCLCQHGVPDNCEIQPPVPAAELAELKEKNSFYSICTRMSDSAKHCSKSNTSTEDKQTSGNDSQPYQCSVTIPFKEVTPNVENSRHKIVTILKEDLPKHTKGPLGVGYSVKTESRRQLSFYREAPQITEKSQILYSNVISMPSTGTEQVPAVGGTSHGTVAGIIIVLLLVCCAGVAILLIQKRRRNWPFARNNHGYHFSTQSDLTFPVKSGGTVGKTSPLLQESLPEIQEFRELQAQCPMILPPKLDMKEAIGHGRFGIIHKGFIIDVQQDVIVHSIKSPFRQSVEEIREFLDDFSATANATQHPNILSLLGVCDQDETMLICIEYVGGPNLRTLLRESRTLEHFPDYAVAHNTITLMSAQRLFNIMLGVTRAICHLEDREVVHPCVSAVSVLIGEGGTPKLSGFGFAKLGDLYMREAEKRHCPLRWMSPETLARESEVSVGNKGQIWAYGVLLWEVMTLGGTPYPDLDNHSLLQSLLQGQVMLSKPNYCSQSLDEVVTECWNLDTSLRPTGMELLGILQDLALHPSDHIDLGLKDDFKYAIVSQEREEFPE